ncbi:MAG: class I SAM-dependent methyltransferase [Betaproteobacteria bacterium]
MTSPHPEPDDTSSATGTRPHLRQLALQFAAVFAVLSLAWPYYGLRNEPLPWPETALAIGSIALLISIISRQPWWWRLIHTFFAPLLWAASELSIDPGWFLLAFILLLLVYRGALSGRIPLYFSNAETANALAELTLTIPEMRFLDLGAGIGSVLRPLARIRSEAQLSGIENAPATWLIGYLSTAGIRNCTWLWGDFWRLSLTKYDVVYAFLSPAPMPALWIKAQREMRPGSLLISNSFEIPEVTPSQIIDVGDARNTRLYCYQL